MSWNLSRTEKRHIEKELKDDVREEVAAEGETWELDQGNIEKQSTLV